LVERNKKAASFNQTITRSLHFLTFSSPIYLYLYALDFSSVEFRQLIVLEELINCVSG